MGDRQSVGFGTANPAKFLGCQQDALRQRPKLTDVPHFRTAVTPVLASTPRPALPPSPFLVAGLGRAGTAAVGVLRQLVGPESLYCWDADSTGPMRRLATEWQGAGIKTWLGAPPALEQRSPRS